MAKAVARKPVAGVDLALLPSVDAAPLVDTTGHGLVGHPSHPRRGSSRGFTLLLRGDIHI